VWSISTDMTDPLVDLPPAAPPSASPGSPRRRLPPFRLSTLLSFLTIAVLTPLLAFGAYSLEMREKASRAAERERLSTLALDLANAVDRELRGQITTAEAVAASRSLLAEDVLSFWRHAEDVASRANGHFILLDSNHQQLVNTSVEFGMPLPKTNNPVLVDAVLQDGEPLVTDLITVAAAGDRRLYSVRVPVVVDGVARYVLSYVPRAGAMLDVLQQSYRPDEWKAVIVDGSGLVIARSHRHEEFYGERSPPSIWQQDLGQSGIISGYDLQGFASLTAYHASGLSDWRVFVWAPEALLMAPARQARQQVLMWAIIAILVSLAVGALAGRLIRAPAGQMAAAARELASGRIVRYQPSLMLEANIVGDAIADASHTIKARETELRNSEESLRESENLLRKNEERMREVMRELSHRSLNLLTVVQLIAKQSSRLARDNDHFIESFNKRIAGLARSHDLLIRTDWQAVPLKDLVVGQLATFTGVGESRLDVDGPMLLLQSQAVQYLGMGLHELATNALKYGALSVPDGRISVRWSVTQDADGADRLQFRWQEHGGPPAKAAERNGFGTVVTATLVPSGLDGTARVELREEGLLWELDAPLASVIQAT
jgi:two-component sensor histidine kinase